MKLWIDDLRPAPFGYRIARSVNEAIEIIETYEIMHRMSGGKKIYEIELIDIDHDAGDFFQDGGDYIKILDWMEVTNRNYPIHIHSMNPVGIENMCRIIQRNGWREVLSFPLLSFFLDSLFSSFRTIQLLTITEKQNLIYQPLEKYIK